MRVRRLDNKHDMTFGRGRGNIASAAECVAQRVKTNLYLLKGEWFLDISAGVQYVRMQADQDDKMITDKPADINYVNSVLKSAVLNTEGVAKIISWDAQINNQTRKYIVSCIIATIYGTTENIKVDRK